MGIGWNMIESGRSWRMSISCCVAEIVQKCSEIKTRSNVSKFKGRHVSYVFFNYRPFTLFKRCGLKLVFIPHSVKSFDFGLWDSMWSACPVIESQFWLLTINYSKNQTDFELGNFLIFMFFTPTCPATLCLVCSRKCPKNSQEKFPYHMEKSRSHNHLEERTTWASDGASTGSRVSRQPVCHGHWHVFLAAPSSLSGLPGNAPWVLHCNMWHVCCHRSDISVSRTGSDAGWVHATSCCSWHRVLIDDWDVRSSPKDLIFREDRKERSLDEANMWIGYLLSIKYMTYF